MLPLRRRSTFAPPPTALERQLVPIFSTMIASLSSLLPFIASEPLLPPFGLLVFLAWRLLRNDIWVLWMGIPLGLWDDLFSGQPLGTAMCGWTAIMLALDAVDRRLPWRGYYEDWAIAALAVAGYLLFAMLIVRITGAATSPEVLIPQIMLSVFCLPAVARFCGALDRWRNPR